MDTTYPNLKPYLLGGATLAVLSLAILNTQHVGQTVPTVFERSEVAETPSPEKPTARSERFAESTSRADDLRLSDTDEALRLAGNDEAPMPVDLAQGQLSDAPALIRQSRPRQMIADSKQTLAAELSSPMPSAAPPASAVRDRRNRLLSRTQPMADTQSELFYEDQGRDKFSDISSNPIKLVNEQPVSTFSIDVDTVSYSFMRASLNNNVLPQTDAVRIEELINYFPYDYAAPQAAAEPFRAHVSVMPTPWNVDTRLMHIGIKGYELPPTDKPHSNLVFLIDTSGSMNASNKLPLLRNSFKLLLSTLQPDDTIAIVTYAGSAGTVLQPTAVQDKAKILAALDRLRSRGSTAGAEGIRQAYRLAERNYGQGGVNRVILATDGDFNVGITDTEELKSYIERKRKTGVFLSVLGFGMGNYNDELMQTLAQNGNGNAAYIDSLSEARKVLVEEAGSTLFTIAKDVKIQVEFNPQAVSEYRLIGYETRLLQREDFNNDKVDAGDIGAGHTVTAIYEITPAGSPGRLIDDLRYKDTTAAPAAGSVDEYAFLKLRYKLPDSDTSTLITTPVTRSLEVDTTASAPREARFAASVAAFGQLLRGGRYTGDYSYDDVINLAQGAKGQDRFAYRAEFINLVRLAQSAALLEPLKR